MIWLVKSIEDWNRLAVGSLNSGTTISNRREILYVICRSKVSFLLSNWWNCANYLRAIARIWWKIYSQNQRLFVNIVKIHFQRWPNWIRMSLRWKRRRKSSSRRRRSNHFSSRQSNINAFFVQNTYFPKYHWYDTWSCIRGSMSVKFAKKQWIWTMWIVTKPAEAIWNVYKANCITSTAAVAAHVICETHNSFKFISIVENRRKIVFNELDTKKNVVCKLIIL